MLEFLVPYLIIFGTAAFLFLVWQLVKRLGGFAVRGVANTVVAEAHRGEPAGASEPWVCSQCHSVNLAEAGVCYHCHGKRSEVEEARVSA
jgi:hypothetical protein